MIALIVIAWVVTGIVSVPLLITWANNHGDCMLRLPALEVAVGAMLGPLPLAMGVFIGLCMVIGKALHRLLRVPTN